MAIMADSPTDILPRDCYRSHVVRLLLGHRLGNGTIQPMHPMTLWRLRQSGGIRFLKLNSRVILYPKSAVEQIVARANNTSTL